MELKTLNSLLTTTSATFDPSKTTRLVNEFKFAVKALKCIRGIEIFP